MSINGHRCNDTEVSVSFKSNSHPSIPPIYLTMMKTDNDDNKNDSTIQ